MDEPTAAISLAFCYECGHVFNTEYDPTRIDYSPGYETSLRGSARFKDYEDRLIDELLRRYQLRGCLIVEIGCGRGEFLQTLPARQQRRDRLRPELRRGRKRLILLRK